MITAPSCAAASVARFFLNRRRAVFGTGAVLLVLSLFFCPQIRISTDIGLGAVDSISGIAFRNSDPYEYLALGIGTRSAFSPETRAYIRELVSVLEEKNSWWTVQAPDFSGTTTNEKSPFLSSSGRAWVILLSLPDGSLTDEQYRFLKEFRDSRPDVYVSGSPWIRRFIKNELKLEFFVLLLSGLALLFLIFTLMFRSLTAAFLLWASCLFPALLVAAVFPALGREITVYTLVAPLCTLGIATSYGIHAWRGMEESCGKVDVFYSLRGKILLLDAGTTILGFLTLLFTPFTEIRFLGLVLVFGLLAAFFSGVICLPLIRVDFSRSGSETRKPDDKIPPSRPRLGIGVRSVLLIVLIGTGAVCFSGLNDLKIWSGISKSVTTRVREGIDSDFLSYHFGSFDEVFLKFDSGTEYGLVDRELYESFLSFRKYLENDENVRVVYDFTDVVRTVLKELPGGNADVAAGDEIGEALELAAGSEIKRELYLLVDTGYRQATVRIRLPGDIDAVTVLETFERWIEAAVECGLPSPFECGGTILAGSFLTRFMVVSQIQSIVVIFTIIFLSLLLITRSFLKSFLICLPPVSGITVALGLSGLLGWHLDTGASLSYAIIAGIGIDDALMYVLSRRSSERTIRPILETTITLVLALMVMISSSFTTIVHIAVIAAAGLIFSTACVVILLPLTDRFIHKESL